MSEPIRLENVAYFHDTFQVLRNVSLSVQAGDTLIITGRSGSGKSILLEICAGLLEPHAGEVLWGGKSVRSFSRDELVHARTMMGYVFQTYALISNMTIFDNLALPLRYHQKLTEPEITDHVNEYQSLLGIEALSTRLPEQLSQGQQQAAAIARALVTEPALLFMDEPGNSLDPFEIQRIIDIIANVRNQRELTLVLTSNIIEIMRQLEAKIAILDDCELIFLDSLSSLTGEGIPEIMSYLRQVL